jgi:hypothetical protein
MTAAGRTGSTGCSPKPSPPTTARKAAERAAREQVVPGVTTGISYEDQSGHWHDEIAAGDDRPETDVKG